ncbi:hypothetical protein PRNP1_004296 [Phytophthora ramorum]
MTPPNSMPAPQPTYNSFASRKRSSPAVKPLPESVAWLKDLKLEMTTTTSRHGSAKYELRVTYQAADSPATSWSLQRSFDQYKAFQKRLLHQLQPTHSCKAECRWLYNTVRKHFPKPTLIGSRYPPVIEQRRKALLQLLTTVQASVVNHGNRNCKVMMNEVSQEFAAFLVDDGTSSTAVTPPATPTAGSEMATPAGSLPSFTSSVTSDEFEEEDKYDEDQWTAWPVPIIEHFDLERAMSSPV